MPNIGVWDWIIIVGIVLLLFGAKRLPELGRSVGRSLSAFKEGLKDVEKEIKNDPENKNS
ncbi:MAG: twin-arginine translocase TatA/TatE family subunit [Elusimicrobia bacterium]|nr:twin-arginine translocase TatA/TatE family subunit [Elusimicrobiota bacterium]